MLGSFVRVWQCVQGFQAEFGLMADDHRRYLGRREAKSEEGRIEPPAAEDGVAPVKPPDPPAGQVVPAKSRPWLPGVPPEPSVPMVSARSAYRNRDLASSWGAAGQ